MPSPAAGAAAGAAAGSVVPGIGTAIGAIGGAAISAIGNWFGNRSNRKASAEAFERESKFARVMNLNASTYMMKKQGLLASGQAMTELYKQMLFSLLLH